jgi:glycosyltransferase involved in cell wall biosynthesis
MIHDLAVEFSRQGHDVTVLTPSDSISNRMCLTFEDSVRVVRVRTHRIKGASKVLRAVREVRLSNVLWSRSKWLLTDERIDLIVFYSPTIFWTQLVRRVKAHWQCPAYLVLRDIFPQWVVDAGILRKGLVWRYFRRREIQQYDVADLIGVESPANLRYFAENFPAKAYPLQVLYNWTCANHQQTPTANPYRVRLGLTNKVVFLYGGNLGIAQDLDNIIRLATRLSCHKDIHFLLVGNGSEAARLERRIAVENLQNIKLLGALPEQEYMSLLSEADVGLISLDRRLRTYNITGKLLGYCSLGKPVLASVNVGNDLFEILGKNQAGLCLLNGKDHDLAAAALVLAHDQQLRRRMGENSRALVKDLFSPDATTRQILNTLQTPLACEEQKSRRMADSLTPVSS